MSAAEVVSTTVNNEEMLRLFYATTPLDHRAIAILERDVWAAYGSTFNGPRRPKRDHWFAQTFGVKPPTHVMFRQAILSFDSWAKPLWATIGYRDPSGEEVSLRKIYGVCLALRLNPNCADEARRLAENPSLIIGFKIANGRDRNGGVKTVECSPGDARELRQRIRELVKPFTDQRIAEFADPGVATDAILAFDAQVQAAVTDLLRTLNGLRSTNGAKSVIEIKRRDLRRACEMLGIKLPARGGTIDMEKARRAHRKLSAQFHPDRTNGNEQMTSQYLEVQKAWEVISEYQA